MDGVALGHRPRGYDGAASAGGSGAREPAQALALGLHVRSRVEALEAVGDGRELGDEALALGGRGEDRALGAGAEPAQERRQCGAQQLPDEDDAEDLEVERLVAALQARRSERYPSRR